MIDGATFNEKRDGKRLAKQQQTVRDLMLDGEWRTLGLIAQITGAPEASVSARLRDLRKCGYLVERKYIKRGLHQYRVTKAEPAPIPVGRTLSQVLAHQIVMEADEYA
jgi:DNA-binding HxlR family transcriptional regulator